MKIRRLVPVLALVAAFAGLSQAQPAASPAPATKKSSTKASGARSGSRATLSGKTNVLQHKGVATRLARAQGATEVINNIEPSEEARQKAAANLTKGRRRAQVKRGDARSEQ